MAGRPTNPPSSLLLPFHRDEGGEDWKRKGWLLGGGVNSSYFHNLLPTSTSRGLVKKCLFCG